MNTFQGNMIIKVLGVRLWVTYKKSSSAEQYNTCKIQYKRFDFTHSPPVASVKSSSRQQTVTRKVPCHAPTSAWYVVVTAGMAACLCRRRDWPSSLMLGLQLSSVLRFRLLFGCVAGCTTRMGTLLVKRPPAYVPTLGLKATNPYTPPARCKLVTAVLCREWTQRNCSVQDTKWALPNLT